jgi:multidrug efflux pump
VGYVGNGSPRYYLSLDQQLFRANFAQFVILTQDVGGRDRALARLRTALDRDFPGIRSRAFRTPLGPPVAYPVQFRVMGPDTAVLKADRRAGRAGHARESAHAGYVHADWGERSPAIQIEIDQDKARAIGLIVGAGVARDRRCDFSGVSVGTFRERDKLIEVLLRHPRAERVSLSSGARQSADPDIAGPLGAAVPGCDGSREVMEEPIIWRRSRTPTLTVRADTVEGVQAPDVAMQIDPKLAGIRTALPPGYRIEIGGPYEENVKAQGSINAGMPMMLALVVGLLMIQLQSFSLTFMVLITAPLGIIGVAAALLGFGQPFGFVAMLGVIALGGMIMRNTVILVDQIRQDLAAGASRWDAVRESTVRRFRPISLTAAAAVLAMVPLSRDVLWGPMAYAIMGGLIVATLLTVLFVPALYGRATPSWPSPKRRFRSATAPPC